MFDPWGLRQLFTGYLQTVKDTFFACKHERNRPGLELIEGNVIYFRDCLDCGIRIFE